MRRISLPIFLPFPYPLSNFPLKFFTFISKKPHFPASQYLKIFSLFHFVYGDHRYALLMAIIAIRGVVLTVGQDPVEVIFS